MLQQYQQILVAVDGSSKAELAFQKAVSIAKRNDANLLLVHVIDTRAFQDVNSFDSMLAEQATDLAKQSLADYKKEAESNGVEKVETTIEYGSPKLIIAKQIPQDKKVDLVVLGATGLNAVERLFIGSVSEYVTRNASCDVLIVRTDTENKKPNIEKN